MKLPPSTVPCEHCGADIEVRSFRPAPSRCPHCGALTSHGIGCLLIGLAGAVAFGLVGAGIEWLIGQFGVKLAFRHQLTIFFAVDGIGITTLWYWRSTSRAQQYGPLGAFLTFAYIGMKWGGGVGAGSILIGAANGIFGLVVAWILSHRAKMTQTNEEPPPELPEDRPE